MKQKDMLLFIASDLIMLTTASLLSPWRYGYESKYFPMYDYNQELSDCNSDLDCETLYLDYKVYPNYVIVSNNDYEFYNGLYT